MKQKTLTKTELLQALKKNGSKIDESTLRRWIDNGIFLQPRNKPGKDGKDRVYFLTDPVSPYVVIMWAKFLSKATKILTIKQIQDLINFQSGVNKDKSLITDKELETAVDGALVGLNESARQIDKDSVIFHNSLVYILLGAFNGLLGDTKIGNERSQKLKYGLSNLTAIISNAKKTIELTEKYVEVLKIQSDLIQKNEDID